jgi:beta-galactosidase
MEKSIHTGKLTLGVCYYPEHWPQEMWADDLKRMKAYGIEVARIAEFAWNKFEPSEGTYTFDFFDRFLAEANRAGVKIIMGTPSATPPAWLTEKYPEVLNAKADGTLYRHGMRRHYNYNSPVYRQKVCALVEKMAEHYCPNPAVAAWQIDNEMNCEMDRFYSQADHAAFRAYLKEKYGTLDALNEAMGTVFWNQTYTSWDEIFLTRTTLHEGQTNPHLQLEEKKFISRSVISFCKMQADIIRKYAPAGQVITTNGIFNHLDTHEMTDQALDFITYDSYPNFAFDTMNKKVDPEALNDRKWSDHLAVARSVSSNFGVMEQQSGPGGWVAPMAQPSPRPGQMRLWTYQSVANGADYIGYFRWRTCWVGTEIYWHGLNDYSNRPNRRLAELEQIRDEFAKLGGVAGTKYKAQIAVLRDYPNEWDGEEDVWHGPLDRFSQKGWFAAAQKTHTPIDYLYLRESASKTTTLADLKSYRLLVYPHATILTERTAELLRAYVEQGGTLLMGARTGYKDEYGRCPMRPMPGLVSELCGVTVDDFTFLSPAEQSESAEWGGTFMEAPVFNDILSPLPGAEVLAFFRGSYYDGAPALVENRVGRGVAYYFGAGFSEQTASTFLRKLGLANPYGSVVTLPEGVELAVRAKDGEQYFFLLNYKPYAAPVTFHLPAVDLLSGKKLDGATEIDSFGVLVFKTQ